uniref:Uncharacterized protein n=1 Tax=Setaria italica TaxID=4555 RepID=K3YFH3_SETIT
MHIEYSQKGSQGSGSLGVNNSTLPQLAFLQ